MVEWTPIDHVSPLPRIEINKRVPITQPAAQTFWEISAECDEKRRLAQEADRIWKITRQVAEGTNPSAGTFE
jgi:hypothetical protein